jgi:hypothetical protein
MATSRSGNRARTPAATSDADAQQQRLQSQHREAPEMSRPTIWHKNNYGFWLFVCVVISLLFSIIYRAFT